MCFSFGCTAIFLLGGATKQTKPIPIYIRSGDVVVMFGPGRLNYHGVARIMPDSWPSENVSCCHPVSSSSSDSASSVKIDTMSLTKNADLHERPSDSASLVSDDLRSIGKRQLYASAANGLCVTGQEEEGGGGGEDHEEKDFCYDSQVIDELVTGYMKTARINVNVRQVFAASSSSSHASSSSISSSSSCSLPLNYNSQCIF